MGYAKLKAKLSINEYLEGEEISQIRYEYIHGEVYAMAGVSQNHNRISGNLFKALAIGISDSKCEVFSENIKVRPSVDVLYYPDLLVTCEGDFANKYICEFPVLIVEVTSPSTERIDHLEKLPAYKSMPSVREIVIVDQNRFAVEVYRRGSNDEWTTDFFDKPEDIFHLNSVDLDFTVADVYARVIFDAERQLHPAEIDPVR